MDAESGEITFRIDDRRITTTSKLSPKRGEGNSVAGITQHKRKTNNPHNKTLQKSKDKLKRKKNIKHNEEEEHPMEQETETWNHAWDPSYEISDEEESMYLQNARTKSKRAHQDDTYSEVDPRAKKQKKELNREQRNDIHDSFSEEHRERLRARVQSDPRHSKKLRPPRKN